MGVPNSAGRLQFTAGHPLESWRTDGQLGIDRTPSFAASAAPAGLRTEIQTIAPAAPRRMRPMGASTRWSSTSRQRAYELPLDSSTTGTAARDPLFMLHANVDRLWAKWQWIHKRTNPAQARSFAAASPNRVGHRLADTMWPWNGATSPPRPSTAPGGRFPASTLTTAPGVRPTVRSMIDYQAVGGASLGVCVRRRALRAVTTRQG